jgi:alkanesulfonate monooxygenase
MLGQRLRADLEDLRLDAKSRLQEQCLKHYQVLPTYASERSGGSDHAPEFTCTVTIADLSARAARYGRRLKFGWRSHVIVRDTEEQARAAARRLLSRLDPEEGARIRARSLDSTSAGVRRQAELRDAADDEGYVSRHLWTGVGRARSGAGAAIVGDPDQVLGELAALRDAGIDAFILSGYPHLAECDLFARHVLTRVPHGPLEVDPQPVVVG